MTQTHYPLVIIGAGPAGLAAALYAAREGISTLILEKGVVGGMAAITAQIDNYPGFDKGVGGLELADHLHDHATRFGAEVRTGVDLGSVKRTGDHLTLDTSAGPISADAVLVATGSTYKQLGVPGEKALIGRGVHFCATCDAPLYRGKHVAVVGGGNSAIQESLFVARFAKRVTLLVRGPELGGSEVLREQLQSLSNIEYRFNTEIKSFVAHAGKLDGVRVADGESGQESQFAADAVFVFIGLLANTQPFEGTLDLDDHKFIITKPDFSTNLPGVFAAGDVRSGSTWQIASAVGEGVSSALNVRTYLDKLEHARRHARVATAPDK